MLSLKKKSSASSDAPENTKKPITVSARELLIVLAVVITGAWVYWSQQNLVVAKHQQQLLAVSQQQAKKAEELLQFHVRRISGLLVQFSERGILLDALAKQDSDLQSWQSNLTRSLPKNSEGAILRMDIAPEAQYPEMALRFAELDLINQAKRSENTVPEIGGDNGQKVATFVSPIQAPDAQSDKPIGVTLARVPVGYFSQAFARNGNFDGKVRLIQTFAKTKPQTVLNSGQGSGQEVVVKINHLWSLHFQPGPKLAASVKHTPWALYISWPIVLLVALAAALLIASKHARIQASKTANANARNQNSIMAVQVAAEDQNLLAGESAGRSAPKSEAAATRPATANSQFPRQVFRAYDVRGLAPQQINASFAEHLGKAIGTRLKSDNSNTIFVGRDGRSSSPDLCQALIAGLNSTGVNVLELGLVPSPLLYYAVATSQECDNGVIVTASHNSADYNGFKITLAGQSLSEEEIQQLHSVMESGKFAKGQGNSRSAPVTDNYIDEILSDIALMGEVKLVIDAGNGATSEIAPLLFSEMGCDVIPLYCEVDGSFPNHDPDPSKAANLQDLIAKVEAEQADLGVAFDGDGDRIFVVTQSGEIITPDRLLMLFARDIVARNPGTDVVYDVKCTRQLGTLISSYGGRPVMWKTGHANMKNKIQETGALLGGEYSGHIFIKDRWHGFDDGMFAAARLLEIMSLREQSLDDIFEAFPILPSSPEIRIPVPDEKKFAIIEKLIEFGDFQSGTASTIDGLRVDFAKGWGLARASNTGPELTLRFEGETEDVIEQLKMLFKRELEKVDANLNLDF
ncbi:phosphomannomutase/phosphoglucomutase [Halioxenophilus aromaticivorans]|uniref:phosphomannomutase n=1 Tax=Halioxenophilus aromaticivorans TaxID=1306992 RepID=A0AAV3TWZ8_9ALTE